VARAVWKWWSSRGILPTAREPRGCLIDTRLPGRMEPQYLEYFSTKLSRTVGKAVGLHGLRPVLNALGLMKAVELDQQTEDK
jgi:hypothetical protein